MARPEVSGQKIEVIWSPHAGPQTALIACPCFEVFFGGARGGGKTDGMLGEWISHQDQYGGHCIGLMVRRERTQLVETIERSRLLYLPLGAKFNEVDKMWRFPNGSRLRFAYLERDADADAYMGHSYTRVYVEEITTFPSDKPILKLMGTLRSAYNIPVGFRATGNPGGPGHQWVKARYVKEAPMGWKIFNTEYENPWTKAIITRDRVFIPSKVTDNPSLGGNYVAQLQMSGGPAIVKAWLYGDWSIIDGAYFPEFSEHKHVIAPTTIPAHWLRFRSGDWGSFHPFSFGWWAVAGDDLKLPDRIIPRGSLIRYREWYGSRTPEKPNEGVNLTAEEVAAGIVQRETSEPNDLEGKTAIAYGVLDPRCFANEGGPPIAERMARAGVFFRRADNKRVPKGGAMGGWDQVRARLIGEDGRPMIYFFHTCIAAIRDLPALQHDPDKAEDVQTDSVDHAPDEIRYACMSRPYVRQLDKGPATRILGVGPHNQVTLNDLWDAQPKRKLERI